MVNCSDRDKGEIERHLLSKSTLDHDQLAVRKGCSLSTSEPLAKPAKHLSADSADVKLHLPETLLNCEKSLLTISVICVICG